MRLPFRVVLSVCAVICPHLYVPRTEAVPIYDTSVDTSDYSGTRTVGGGLAGQGAWADGAAPEISLTWLVVDNSNGTFTYRYTLSYDPADLDAAEPSHLLVDLSDNCVGSGAFTDAGCVTAAMVDETSLPSEKVVPGTFDSTGQGNSNPGLPAAITGVKLDAGGWVYEFTSNRVPVWGDLYSKDGNAGGGDTNAVWNTGIANHASESESDFVPRPDSVAGLPPTEVPEPGTLALVGSGLVAAGLALRRRRKPA